MSQEYLLDFHLRLQAEVTQYGLEAIFSENWFTRVEEAICEWDGQGIFTLDRETFFISYVQSTRDGRSLPKAIRRSLDLLSASPKTNMVNSRFGTLAGDTANAVGAVFEVLSLLPLITSPNQLVEYQAKIGSSESRSEALVQVADCEFYVEATVFTRRDPASEAQAAFSLDPGEQEASEGATIRNKILAKDKQCRGADKPVLTFLAEGLVTTGLAMGGDPRELAMRDLTAKGANSLSAVVFAKDAFCDGLDLRVNASASFQLTHDALSWIEENVKGGWWRC